MEIREAGGEDRDWAAALLAGTDPWIRLGATLERCLEVCRDPLYDVFVGVHAEGRVGVLVLQDEGLAGAPYLKSIAVDAGARGRGVGAALLDFAEGRYRGRARWFFLCVSSFNHRARSFYERHGYEAVGELPRHVVDGASEIIMRKELA